MEGIEKLDLAALEIKHSKIAELKRLFPEVFTEGDKIDWDKLKLALGEQIDAGKERYSFTWPGKSECFKTIQQPSVGTLKPCPEESVNFETTENLFIEGDNLEVLKLLQKSYFGKIKMIYIDPPYNTGKEFIYPDNYKEGLDTYLEYTGQKNSNGKKFGTNTEQEGRYHSNWLNMMHPRLTLARNLLRDDGVIFISIDDHEVGNLRKICDEIFGEENFVASIIWEKKYSPSNDAKWLSDNHDYIIVYARDKEKWRPVLLPRTEEANARYSNPDNDLRGEWKPSGLDVRTYSKNYDYEIITPSGRKVRPPEGACWRVSRERFAELVKENRIWFGTEGNNVPAIKRFLSEVKQGITPLTIWKYSDVGHNQEATQELKELGINVFTSPKPTRLLERILEISTFPHENDLILDFFSGSGTMAHAVLNLNSQSGGNRRFIVVQLPEPTNDEKFLTIAEITKERIRRVIKEIQEKQKSNSELFKKETHFDLGFKVFKLIESNFKIWDALAQAAKEQVGQQILDYVDHIQHKATQEDLLYELLLKLSFPLNEKVEKLTLAKKHVFKIADGSLLICLEKELTMELIQAMIKLEPSRIICLDDGFRSKDELKANIAHTIRGLKDGSGEQKIVFQTI